MTVRTSSGSAAARLARRLDRSVVAARFEQLLRVAGVSGAAAAAALLVAAGLDAWLRPERFWLGGSLVWLTAAAAAAWQARRLGLPASWPTRLSMARRLEQRIPDGGTVISAAVGFLDQLPGPLPADAVSASGFVALAVEQADRAASRSVGQVWKQPAGLVPALLGPAAFGGLLALALLGPHDWRNVLARQLPPAVGGWSPAVPQAVARPPAPPLRPAEIPAVTRRLIARLIDCRRAVSSPEFNRAVTAAADEARLLVDRLPAGAGAGFIRWSNRLLAQPEASPNRVSRVRQLAATGKAAVQLAATAAIQQGVVDQLGRLLPRQPGLCSDELSTRATRQLALLADAQQAVAAATVGPAALLREAGLLGALGQPAARLPDLLRRNRLGLALVAAGYQNRLLAKAVTDIGLDLPPTAASAAGSGTVDLSQAVVAVAVVAAAVDEQDRLLAAAPETLSSAATVNSARPPGGDEKNGPAVAGPRQPGDPDSAGGPGLAAGSGGGQTAARPAVLGLATGSLPPGIGWRLVPPDRRALGRRAFDQTLPPEAAAVFNDYLERLLPLSETASPSPPASP